MLLQLEDVRGLAAGGGRAGLGRVLADRGSAAGSARRWRRGPRSGGPRGPRRSPAGRPRRWASASGRPSRARAWPWVIFLRADRVLDLLGEVEQADQVRDGRAVEAEPAGELLLGPAVAGEVVAEGGRLFERVEVLALEVLDHRQLADPLVVEVHDAGGDLVELGLDAGAEPALAGDELVAVVDRPDEDRLDHAVLAERVGQGGDLGRVELPAGLERVRVDLVDGDVESARRRRASRARSPLRRARAGLPGRVRVVAYSRSMTSMTSSA